MAKRCQTNLSENESISTDLTAEEQTEEHENECLHNTTIDDEQSGDCVCIKCGLVLEQLYMLDYKHKQHIETHPHAHTTQIVEGELNTSSIIAQFLVDIGHNAHIPLSIINHATWYSEIVKGQLRDKKIKFTNKEIAAFALYETLNERGVSRTVQEIAVYTQVSCTSLWDIECAVTKPNTLINPQNLVERYCTALQLSYGYMSEIRTIVGNMYGMGGIRPQCLVAAAIYLYCHSELYPNSGPTPSLKQICDVCIVSPTTVNKIIKKLDPKYVANISLLYSSFDYVNAHVQH
jgi:transcription initiation factor TFIIIB Brf1 subunit/transcription initiation factor TFIIB